MSHPFRKPPADLESGPNDNPDDPSVELDPDDGLPWPDPEKLRAWYVTHRDEFPAGYRRFMGRPPSREHCIAVLKNGFQRQRRLAAQYLALMDPQTPWFNIEAPAWRQKRLLAAMN